jgi:hypothetical protein
MKLNVNPAIVLCSPLVVQSHDLTEPSRWWLDEQVLADYVLKLREMVKRCNL